MFRKVLIANRGEVALRVMRACRKLGMKTVAVYSEADAASPHAQEADEAYVLGPAPVAQSYLRADRIVEIALASGAEAIHPGYGLLSENADFAQLCAENGLVFVGPSSDAIRAMGSKVEARLRAHRHGIPVVPGSEGSVADADEAADLAARLGYPVLLKASAGGGGIGMTVAHTEEGLRGAFASAGSRVQSYFGDGTLFLERYLERPRHVEIQVLADSFGKVIHLGERECSIQRRHQKIVEEAPSSAVTEVLRQEMGQAAVRLAAELHYSGVGTVEFLLDQTGSFYFLEMNTRLQVEHPVTEEVFGVDLVEWQFRVAAGEPLTDTLLSLQPRGHAIECRICAEDPERFIPSPGVVTGLRAPMEPYLRHEIGVRAGDRITPFYDSMFAKIIARGDSREEARRRMLEALERYEVEGVKTNLPLLRRVLADPDFASGKLDTDFLRSRFGL